MAIQGIANIMEKFIAANNPLNDTSQPVDNNMRREFLAIVGLLIYGNFDLNYRQLDYPWVENTNLISVAIQHGFNDVIPLLVDYGADINQPEEDDGGDEDDMTPLAYAIQNGNIDLVRLLIDKGADVNYIIDGAKYIGFSPLHIALRCNQWNIFNLLLERGADVYSADNEPDSESMVGLAVYTRDIKIVNEVIALGADVNKCTKGMELTHSDYEGVTPLFVAASEGLVEMVRCLIVNHLANVEYSKGAWGFKNQGLTPLHIALKNGHAEVARVLIENGADFETPLTIGKYRNLTPLQMIVHEDNIPVNREMEIKIAQVASLLINKLISKGVELGVEGLEVGAIMATLRNPDTRSCIAIKQMLIYCLTDNKVKANLPADFYDSLSPAATNDLASIRRQLIISLSNIIDADIAQIFLANDEHIPMDIILEIAYKKFDMEVDFQIPSLFIFKELIKTITPQFFEKMTNIEAFYMERRESALRKELTGSQDAMDIDSESPIADAPKTKKRPRDESDADDTEYPLAKKEKYTQALFFQPVAPSSNERVETAEMNLSVNPRGQD